MDFPATIVVITVVLVEIKGMTLYFGHEVQNYYSHRPAQPKQQQYAESILFLTPSQIKALRESEDQIDRPEVFHPDSATHHHSPAYSEASERQQLIHFQPHHDGNPLLQFVYPQPSTTPAVPQSSIDHFQIIPTPNYHESKTIMYNTFQTEKQKRILKPIPFFPDDSNKQTYNNNNNEPNIHYKNNKPKTAIIIKNPPIEKPAQDTDENDEIIRQLLKEQWLQVLKQNIAHFKALQVKFQNQVVSNKNNTKFHYLTQEDERYNDKNYAAEVYNLVRSNNQQKLNKQRTVLRSEAVASTPPLPYNDINVKHILAPFVAQAAGPQTAEFVSIPDSFREKDPQKHEFPLKYYKTVSYPNIKQTNEMDRPVPNKAEVQIPFPVTMYYSDRPFSPVQIVSVKNPAPNREKWLPFMRDQHH